MYHPQMDLIASINFYICIIFCVFYFKMLLQVEKSQSDVTNFEVNPTILTLSKSPLHTLVKWVGESVTFHRGHRCLCSQSHCLMIGVAHGMNYFFLEFHNNVSSIFSSSGIMYEVFLAVPE